MTVVRRSRAAIVGLALGAGIVASSACSGPRGDSPTGSGNGPDSTPSPLPDGRPVIAIDPSVRYQTMKGWEATAEAGQTEIPTFAAYRDRVAMLAVDSLGLNRLRLEIRSGAENPRDIWREFATGALSESQWRCQRYATINDNADPRVVNSAGFHFSEMDAAVEGVVLPMKARLDARGERLYLNVNYVAFAQQCAGTPYAHNDAPEEYAEFVVATYDHLRTKYGLTPDSWEVILEPDNTGLWNGAQIGRAIAAAGKRLSAAGYTPRFVAPSTVSMARAVTYVDAMMAVPDAAPYVSELSYHRYEGVSDASLDAIGERARRFGVGAGMLEHIGSDYRDLHADLTRAANTSWQQFTLAFTGTDDGDKYFVVGNGASPTVSFGARTKFLRQYFYYVRSGAVRVRAVSGDAGLDAVAFTNTDGGTVVVVVADRAASFRLTGLPAGTYGASYTTAAAAGVELAAAVIQAGQGLDIAMQSQGVLTVYRRR